MPLFQSQVHTMKQSVSILNGVTTRCQYQSKHFTFLHILHSPCLLIRLRRNGGWIMNNRRLSKFFRRFIFAKRRFDFIEWRKNSPDAATPSHFCAISLLFPTNRGVRFAEKQPPFRRLKLPKRTRKKRIFRHLRNLTTVKSDGCDKD